MNEEKIEVRYVNLRRKNKALRNAIRNLQRAYDMRVAASVTLRDRLNWYADENQRVIKMLHDVRVDAAEYRRDHPETAAPIANYALYAVSGIFGILVGFLLWGAR